MILVVACLLLLLLLSWALPAWAALGFHYVRGPIKVQQGAD
jgi:hypothetical protein